MTTTLTDPNSQDVAARGLHGLHGHDSMRMRSVAFKIPQESGVAAKTVHLVPLGEELSRYRAPKPDFSGPRDQPCYVLTIWDEEARSAMLDSFSGDVLVDYEHSDQSIDPASSTEAAGWGKRLMSAVDGLELEIDWTPTGRAKIEGKEYRFISPVVDGPWENLEGGDTPENPVVFRPRRLLEAGLTNRPALMGRLRPISFRENSGGSGSGHEPKQEMKTKTRTLLCSLLTLDAAATEDAIETKLGEFVAGDLTTMRNRAAKVDELEREIETLKTEMLDGDLEAYKDVIVDKDSAKALFRADRASAIKTFGAMRQKQGEGPGPIPHTSVAHRGNPKPPSDEGHQGSDDREQRIAARAMKIVEEDKCSLGEANRRARAEVK